MWDVSLVLVGAARLTPVWLSYPGLPELLPFSNFGRTTHASVLPSKQAGRRVNTRPHPFWPPTLQQSGMPSANVSHTLPTHHAGAAIGPGDLVGTAAYLVISWLKV